MPQVAGIVETRWASGLGWMIFAEAEAVHPLASVMVQMMVPAVRFWAVWVVAPFDHA